MNKKDYIRAKRILEGYGKSGIRSELRDVIQGWLASNDSKGEKEAALRNVFESMVTVDRRPGAEPYKALAKSHKLLGFPVKRGRKVSLGRRLMQISAAAATVAIIAGGGWLMYNNADTAENMAAIVEVRTDNDDATKNIILPDGSEIRLGKGSVFSYDEDAFVNDRTIQLEGDAYFKVVKMDGKTFTVNTSSIRVTVYGTEFHMNAYDAAGTAEVRLTAGIVSVKAEGIEETMMKAGDHVVYDKTHKNIELHEIGEAELMRLRGMSLSFEEPLDSILRNIGRQYSMKMKVQEDIPLGGEVVLELKGDETIDDVMFILKKATDLFDYEIKQDSVIVYNRK